MKVQASTSTPENASIVRTLFDLFNFLQECVQKGVYFGAYMAPIFAYSLKVVPRSQIAWNKENSIKPSLLEAKLTVFEIQLTWLKHLLQLEFKSFQMSPISAL